MKKIIFFEIIFVTKWIEDSFIYKYYVEESSSSIFYEPEYVVEGYKLESHKENNIVSVYEYYNSKLQKQYNISQELVTDGEKVVFDIEYDSKDSVTWETLDVDIYRYQDGYVRAYAEYGQYIFCVDADDLSDDQLKMIFENWIN